ncbi:MAG: trigger factor [Synergistaceae bacterium]|nr:trigger factor [Synergistaceae bacterium]
MKTELLGQEKNVVKIKLELTPEEFADGLNKAIKQLSQEVKIPGFRKGHAPRKVLEMRFGRDALYNEALDKILPDNIKQITEDYELETIDTPEVKVEAIHEGETVTCEISFEVMPEVELPEIESFEVERLKSNVPDEALEDLIWNIRRRFAEKNPVERAVQADDIVNVEFTIQVQGEDTEIGPNDNQIDLADKSVRKEVAEALTDHAAGETVETDFDIEPNHVEKRIAGKRVHYIMGIKQVFECVMPEINEELFKKYFGADTDINTEEAFRAKLSEGLKSQMEHECAEDAENRAMDRVIKESKLELPDKLVMREMQAIRAADEREAKGRYNLELKDYLGDGTPDWERGYNVVLRSRAQGVVRYSLVVNAIAKKYDINVEQEDIDAELENRAALYGLDKKMLISYYYQNQNELNGLISSVLSNKVLKSVMNIVKVKEVDELTPVQPEPEQEQPEANNNNEA